MLFKFLLLIYFSTFINNSMADQKIKNNFKINDSNLYFELIAMEDGPKWSCKHEPSKVMPNDWKILCTSLTSDQTLKFKVHLIARQMRQGDESMLEILYWVDEVSTDLNAPNISQGQNLLMRLDSNKSIINKLSLGQFVQNGTSILNVKINN